MTFEIGQFRRDYTRRHALETQVAESLWLHVGCNSLFERRFTRASPSAAVSRQHRPQALCYASNTDALFPPKRMGMDLNSNHSNTIRSTHAACYSSNRLAAR